MSFQTRKKALFVIFIIQDSLEWVKRVNFFKEDLRCALRGRSSKFPMQNLFCLSIGKRIKEIFVKRNEKCVNSVDFLFSIRAEKICHQKRRP